MPSGRIHGLQGMTFGAMDAIIMVIGVIVGLGVIGNRTAVFVGVLVAGIANSFGNAWGFHISEETENIHTRREVWVSTIMSFSGTLVSTIILLLPVLMLPLNQAISVTVIIGICMIILIGIAVGRIRGVDRTGCCKLILEYVSISILVIVIAYYLGQLASGIVL
jgi:VIT1/CCC1 family predicted Fe2+/Mn2+ transporter